MSCTNTRGRWNRARLILSGMPEAQQDDHLLEIDPITTPGVITGKFLSLATGNPPLEDDLINGTCVPEGVRSRITFTRIHADGIVTTIYTGIVIPVAGTTILLIRGTFTRTTVGLTTMASGDWETEKPT